MIIWTCYFVGSSRWAGKEPDDMPPATAEQAIARLNGWNEAGVPFFTREAIQEVAEQLKRPFFPGQKILVKGLDGAFVEFDVRTGETYDSFDEEGFQYEVTAPVIEYNSFGQLTRRLSLGGLELEKAYCPLQIMHRQTLWNKQTKEQRLPVLKDHIAVSTSFETSLRSWRECAAWKQLESILTTAAATHKMNKVIGLGCGSMASDELPGFASTPDFQHALLVTIRDWIAQRDSSTVHCYAQDPIYTELDKSVLEGHGIEVIEDPQAWLEVDDSSVVFSRGPDVPVKEIVADLARPAVLVWDRVKEDEFTDGIVWANPNTPRVHKMIEDYDLFELDSDPEHFEGVVIYIRKQDGQGTA